jgi:hypothetical protein
MEQFTSLRKAFVIAGVVFVANWALGTAVALAINLYDPSPDVAAHARDSWVSPGTAISAPLVFMAPYVLFLALATRKRWVGAAGTAIVMALSLISNLSAMPDWAGTQEATMGRHILVLPAAIAVTVLILNGIVCALGGAALYQSWRARRGGVVAAPAR